jgi:GAF domain-containing protein
MITTDFVEISNLSADLLKRGINESAMFGFLAQLGRIARVDRVYIFENRTASDGRVTSSQRYEWNSGVAEPQLENPELQDLDLGALLPQWVAAFARGESYHGRVRELDARERDILSPQGILSILVCPIRVGTEVWGFVGFDDCQRERDWQADEILVLAQASRALAGALRHRDLQQRLAAARSALQGVVTEVRGIV